MLSGEYLSIGFVNTGIDFALQRRTEFEGSKVIAGGQGTQGVTGSSSGGS